MYMYKFEIHPPVPIHQHSEISYHQIAHHDMQYIYRNRILPPPPPPFPFSMPPSIPQPPMPPNQQLSNQAFVPPPLQPQNFSQTNA